MSNSRASVRDAVAIFGLGAASGDPLPAAAPGEVVIRVGAWSIRDLRTCASVVRSGCMWDDTWYDDYDWSGVKLTPGVYRVRMPVPDSNGKTFARQTKLLLPGEELAPVALAASVLLCQLHQASREPLDGGFARCAESLPDRNRVALAVDLGRVFVYDYRDVDRYDYLWVSGCRKV